jgi:hypothetical protein
MRRGKKPADAFSRSSKKQHVEDLLDEALEESFPASDPVAIDFERSRDSGGERGMRTTPPPKRPRKPKGRPRR